MKAGYVTVQIKNVLLFGMAGTGKTSVQNLIFGLPPPEVRSSTPLAEAPKRVIRNISQSKVQAGDGKWEPVTVKKLEQMLADTIRSIADDLGDIPDELATKLKRLPDNKISAAKTLSTTTVDDTTKSSSADKDPSNTNFEMMIADIAGSVQDIIAKKVIDTSSGRHPREVLGSNWVYFTDSGGQPHFYNLLPHFIKGISAALFALRLCEGLDEHPMVEYYKDGKEVGTRYPAALTTLETFRNLVQSIHSRSEKESLRLVCIGTHLDKESECPEETLEQKNVKLLEDLPQDISDITMRYRSKQGSDKIIFPVDAKNVESDEQREQREMMAKELHMVIDKCPSREIKVPLWWYHFEIILETITREKGRKLLHKQECLKVAQLLRFHEDALVAALEFFHEQHIFHYYPTILPDVVFCDTQVLLDKVTELVEYASFLRDGSYQTPVDGILLRKLRDRGIITLEFLKGFSKHYVKGVFEPPELILIFKELLILTPISVSLHCDFDSSSVTMEYFMPSLLDPLNESDLEKCRVSTAEAAPLLFQFPNGWPRCGVFCCLQVYLVNHCKWELCLDESIPKQNMVILRPPESPCIVTLIDSFFYIELHAEALTKDCEGEYPSIRDNVLEGIKASCEALRYSRDPPDLAFICPCDREQPQTEVMSQASHIRDPSATTSSQKRHVAVFNTKYIKCTKNCRKVYPLERKHKVWLVDVELFTESCYPPVKKLKIELPSGGCAGASVSPNTLFALKHWGLDKLQDVHINGEGTLIAVLDTGINASHISMINSNKISAAKNFLTGEVEDLYNDTDPHSHGTSVAGVAAGNHIPAGACTLPEGAKMYVGNMPLLPIGVAPKASLVIFRVSKSKEDPYDPSAVVKSLECIRDHNDKQTEEQKKIRIVTMPFRFSRDHTRISILIDILKSSGVVCVVAAGNDGLNQSSGYPARCSSVLTVGSVDSYGRISNFSTSDPCVDVLALGENVLIPVNHPETVQLANPIPAQPIHTVTSFYPTFPTIAGDLPPLQTCSSLPGNVASGCPDNPSVTNYFAADSGTSFAAPAVAGLIALLLQCARKYTTNGTAIKHITDPDILKRLFDKYMVKETEQGKLLQPEKVIRFFNFFATVIDGVVEDLLN